MILYIFYFNCLKCKRDENLWIYPLAVSYRLALQLPKSLLNISERELNWHKLSTVRHCPNLSNPLFI